MSYKDPYERSVKVNKGVKDIYALYKQNKINKDEPYLTYTQFAKILFTFNKKLSKLIIEEGYEYKLGYRLGYLRIRKNKMKFKIKEGRLTPNKKTID